MTDLVNDNKYKVAFCTTLSSQSAPPNATLTSGTQLDPSMTPSGLTRNWSGNPIDNSRLNSTFTTSVTGRRTPALSVTIIREATDSTGIEAALAYQATGFLVIRDNIDSSTAWTAAQKCEVYPVQVQQGSKADPAPNTLQTVTFNFDITGTPTLNAVVA